MKINNLSFEWKHGALTNFPSCTMQYKHEPFHQICHVSTNIQFSLCLVTLSKNSSYQLIDNETVAKINF